MPHQLISLLKEGGAVQQYFLVRQSDRGMTKDGKPFLSLVLGDKSGVIKARVWSDVLAKCPGPFAPGDYVGVQGQVESYKGELQLKVGYINTVEALRDLGRDLQEYDPELLCQATPFDRQAVVAGAGATGRNPDRPAPRAVGPHRSWTATGRSSWSAPPPASITTLTWAVSWNTPGS